MKNKFSFFLLLILFLLAACNQQNDLTLKRDEKWELKSEITLNFGLLPSIGTNIMEGLSMRLNLSEYGKASIEFLFENMVNYAESQGYKATWRKKRAPHGDQTYIFIIKGQGWGNLSNLSQLNEQTIEKVSSDIPFPMETSQINVITLEDGNLHFSMTIPQSISDLYILAPFTFNLHGGKIISSNADLVKGGTAIWKNPTNTIEAILTPKHTSPAILIIFIIFFVGLIIAILKIIRNKKTRNYDSYSYDDYFVNNIDNIFD